MPFRPFTLKEELALPSDGDVLSMSASTCEPISIGELFDDPAEVLAVLSRTPQGYPEPDGPNSLRASVAALYDRIGSHEILLSNGADEAILLVFLSLLTPGDEVIVCTPCYPPLAEIPRAIGCAVIEFKATAETGWVPDLTELTKLLRISGRTKLIVLTSPNNPTGCVLGGHQLEELAALSTRFGTQVLVDEAYRGIWFVDAPPAAADVSPKLISVGSVSKTFGLPGLRLGWVASRDIECLSQLRRANAYVGTYLNPLAQLVGSAAIARKAALWTRNTQLVTENLRSFRASLLSNLLELGAPQGGTVALARPRFRTASNFVELMNEHYRLSFLGAYHFGAGDQFIRVGLGMESFTAGLIRLEDQRFT